MFSWFKRNNVPPAPAAKLRTPPTRPRRPPSSQTGWDAPPSLPEVTEGNSDADWSAWQDSVNFQESRAFANSDLPTEPVPLTTGHEEVEAVFENEARNKRR